MLLRLLSNATPSQPAPPTILFTLPLPTHPYTSKSLPLPPNLMAHRSVCSQEDVECSSVLLGEKSSWISGIIDDVTFALPRSQISVHFIDGTTVNLPLTGACITQLERVMNEVQLSFAAASAPVAPQLQCQEASRKSNTSGSASLVSTPSSASNRRSPSALLLTLLSPLLQTGPSIASAPPAITPSTQQPARTHRRQARSLLVDAYRLHVLPIIKDQLPSAYLLWAIQSEINKKLSDFEVLRKEINSILEASGADRSGSESTYIPLKRCGSSSSGFSSDSDSLNSPNLSTPATSIYSHPNGSSPKINSTIGTTPQSFLLSIPPAHSVSLGFRTSYSEKLARLTHLASRLSCIKKLAARYEREEGKRKWLETLEAGRNCDKALRRAWSNGQLLIKPSTNLGQPMRGSKLWKSFTVAEAEVRSLHPAMEPLSPVQECRSSCEISDGEVMADFGVKRSVYTLDATVSPSSPSHATIALPTISTGAEDEEITNTVTQVREVLVLSDNTKSCLFDTSEVLGLEETYPKAPALVQSRSDDSLTDSEWDHDIESSSSSSSDEEEERHPAHRVQRHRSVLSSVPPSWRGNGKEADLVIRGRHVKAKVIAWAVEDVDEEEEGRMDTVPQLVYA